MQEHTQTNYIHADLVENSWMIQCTDECSYTLYTELQTFNTY